MLIGNDNGLILVKRISEGDEAAFRRLFDAFYQRLFHLALYYLKSAETAEEVIGDVFVTVWKRRTRLPDVKNIDRYLYTSVKNRSLHYLRRRHGLPHEPLELYTVELVSSIGNPEALLFDNERREFVQRAIDSLPEKCREVFRLSLSDGLKNREIASLLDISVKTVESHLAAAHKRLAPKKGAHHV